MIRPRYDPWKLMECIVSNLRLGWCLARLQDAISRDIVRENPVLVEFLLRDITKEIRMIRESCPIELEYVIPVFSRSLERFELTAEKALSEVEKYVDTRSEEHRMRALEYMDRFDRELWSLIDELSKYIGF